MASRGPKNDAQREGEVHKPVRAKFANAADEEGEAENGLADRLRKNHDCCCCCSLAFQSGKYYDPIW